MNAFNQRPRQTYINLETFRQSGVGVKTPVWFVQDGPLLFVRTVADSGKAKRIRSNPRVNLAACKADGDLLGEWVPATARELDDEAADRKIDHLLDRKYGLMKKMFTVAAGLRGKKYTILEVKASER